MSRLRAAAGAGEAAGGAAGALQGTRFAWREAGGGGGEEKEETAAAAVEVTCPYGERESARLCVLCAGCLQIVFATAVQVVCSCRPEYKRSETLR